MLIVSEIAEATEACRVDQYQREIERKIPDTIGKEIDRCINGKI